MFETKKELASLGGAFTSAGLSQMDGRMQRQTDREMDQVRSRAVVAATVEQGRGFIAELALSEVGGLSALETHLIQVAPLGEARYKHIVDAYAMGAARTIARFS
ncbi:hypothetical protein [Microbacterium sp. VKM Ac-2923]|uniref:hypothetical protein n=1 Tax=Microbacterium sp. VKM Ac-2923 TaxID=2929476 RepID=UPI001FB434C2|nr:hypothetical protein [Microbacterium sp. VKM Ac-2923]MCJ1707128.1 hypothetical protein [Microbacterium sp. VKM Ac-2923]